MINLFHKSKGAVTLLLTVTLLTLSTLIILFAAGYGIMQEKTTANLSRHTQAEEAATAGLEFAINYLKQNSSTILANPTNGHIQSYSDSNTSNVTLANGSKYTIVYSNPIANNYNLIQITSTGTSDDGSSNVVVTQQVQHGSMLINIPSGPITTLGSVSMTGNALVSNTESNVTIASGSSVSLSGSSQTVTSGGTSSTAGNIQSDIQQNAANLSTLTSDDFFASYFGVSSQLVINNIQHYYNNTSSTNYSSTLNGMTGTSVWISQSGSTTATINGNTVIGSASNPVLLIVNGNLNLSGNTIIYGYVFVTGTFGIDSLSGNVQIIGALGSTGSSNMSGSSQTIYNSSVLGALQTQSSMAYYAKVPGSWKSF